MSKIKELLIRLNILIYLKTEVEISKNEFLHKIKKQVDEGDSSFLSNSDKALSTKNNKYKGSINANNFTIKRRRNFFDMNLNLATARGTFQQKNNLLSINTEINGFSKILIPFYLFAIIFFIIAIVGMFFIAAKLSNLMLGFIVVFIILHAGFMLGVPYYIMISGAKKLKLDIERDLF